jgi:S-adenosylmethionine/arginine decarboxylase-like enzyme
MLQPKEPYKFNPKNPYGYELILDLHECDTTKFNREDLTTFFEKVCEVTDMELAEIHFWDDLETPEDEKQTEAHTIGTSAVCFILTSSIVVHTLDVLKRVYINVFTCKPFNATVAEEFIIKWFNCKDLKKSTFIKRY